MNQTDNCSLCQQERELANSHIIPEFLFELLYDKKHRMHLFKAGQPREHKLIQKGLRSPMLCKGRSSCEERISKWEQYASQVFFYEPVKGSDYNDALVFKGVDYAQFKLFQMSILWRASVSSLTAFNAVSLGPHQERLRKMIYKGDPGEPHEFGCAMSIRRKSLKGMEELIVSPSVSRVEGHGMFTFIINGIIWQFFVSSHTSKLPIAGYFLTRDGELPFVLMPEDTYDNLILRATKELLH